MFLRFSTAGSVDDGKSTLIGRLLYDTKSLFEDQWEAVERASTTRGDEEIDLALLTDGLRAEREQKITIDVAYRYFSTPKRKFIIADTPGHEQYTRNMVTGASTSELAILLVDARKGVSVQTRRHAFISTLLGIPHLVVAINKMDLVDYSEEVFHNIKAEFQEFARRLEVKHITYIPMSALKGDNVVTESTNMPWYKGSTLLRHLETVNLGTSVNVVDFRFPIQYVLRPNQDFRGYAGQISSGRIRPGNEVVALPSGLRTKITKIVTADGEIEEAFVGDSVVLCFEDEIDSSRGCTIVRADNLPQEAGELDVTLCWLNETPLDPNRDYLVSHGTELQKCFVSKINYSVNVNTLKRESTNLLNLNEIGRVQIQLTKPIFFDRYKVNRATGSLVLIDPSTKNTVAAGMIRGRSKTVEDITSGGREALQRTPNTFPESSPISLVERETVNKHKAAVIWFTGLSGSGKSTLAQAVEKQLFAKGCKTMFLDGDNLRQGLCGDLSFTAEDRAENIRRAALVAQLGYAHGNIVICSFISPFEEDRAFARGLVPEERFLEVYASCSLEVCQKRDPKGLYKKAQSGEIKNFTGISSPYQEPKQPEVTAETDVGSVDDCVNSIIARLEEFGVLAD